MRHIYHPNTISRNKDWLLCHVTIGSVPCDKNDQILEINETILPSWYKNLNEEKLGHIDALQDEYVKSILEWIDSQEIITAYLDGGYEKKEQELLKQENIVTPGFIQWKSSYIELLPSINIRNLYLISKTGSEVIIYGSWETIFVSPAIPLPEILTRPIKIT